MGIFKTSTRPNREKQASRIREKQEHKALEDIYRYDHGSVRKDSMLETGEDHYKAGYVRTTQEERFIKKSVKKGDKINFVAYKPGDRKGEYKNITDFVEYLYEHFAKTCKGYCVKYRDIRKYGA